MRNYPSELLFTTRFHAYRLMSTATVLFPVQSGRQVRKAPRRRRLWWHPGSTAEEEEGVRRRGIQICYPIAVCIPPSTKAQN